MSLALLGVGVSRGIVIGRVQHVLGGYADVPEHHIQPGFISDEIARFEQAKQGAHAELERVRAAIPASAPADIAGFIESHIMMLDDSSLSSGVIERIQNEQVNAEWALSMQRDALVQVFEQMDDPYLRARRDDVDHVVSSMLRILLNQQRNLADNSSAIDPDLPRVIVADDVSPAELVALHHSGVGAVLTESGGQLSHTAILARSFSIPMIVGLRNSRQLLKDDELIIVDGQQGQIIAGPESSALEHYRAEQQRDADHRRRLQRLVQQTAKTQDGTVIKLQANIEFFDDIVQAQAANADGVGLYRTEFLYMNRQDEPSEAEQFEAYKKLLEAMQGRPVTVRTLDIGADKQLEAQQEPEVGTNPALGLRGIRLSLQQPRLFKPQLRALLRASAYGPLKIMLPMISNAEEIRQTKQLIEQIKIELDREGHAYAKDLPLGAMIEVPSAAVIADLLAQETDFLSIGTNDLIQYTVAIDRVDDSVNYLYDPLHPGVLRLIEMTIKAGNEHGIPVSMCGEMAGNPNYTKLLLELGLKDFSMHPASLLEVKEAVTGANLE